MSYSRSFLETLADAEHIEYSANGAEDEVLTLYTHLVHFADSAHISTDMLRTQLFKAEKEPLAQTLALLKHELQECRATTLARDCDLILSLIATQGIGSGSGHIETFVADITAFSIAIQLAQHLAQQQKTSPVVAPPPKTEVLSSKTLLAQLKKALEDYDEDKSLQYIGKLESFGLASQLEPIKRHVASFEFDKALRVLATVNVSVTEEMSVKTRVVLAVDDMPQNLSMLRAILGERYKFVGLTSGAAALKYLETNTPDVYILDIEMPNMNGFELVTAIRANRKIAPFIFLTGNATREHVIQAMSMGITDFLVKPCNKDAVFAKLDAIFVASNTAGK